MTLTAARVRCAAGSAPAGLLDEVRLVLLSYLYARQSGGRLMLRVDDADASCASDCDAALRRDLAWLGLHWDDAPGARGADGYCLLSAREALHRRAARRLLDGGHAFIRRRGVGAYTALSEGQPGPGSGAFSVCFQVSGGEVAILRDLLRGEVRVPASEVGDFAIYRAADEAWSAGCATSSLAAAVDDATMGVAHVFRSKEDLMGSARQALLAEALGYPVPTFTHLSPSPAPVGWVAEGEDSGLSSAQLRQAGYLPEAVLAWLVSADWTNREGGVTGLDGLVERFELGKLRLRPQPLNVGHLNNLGRRAMAAAPADRVGALLRPRLQVAYGRWHSAEGTAHGAEDWYHLLVTKGQQEVPTLTALVALCRFAFVERITRFTAEASEALRGEWVRPVLQMCYETLTPEGVSTPDRAALSLQELRHYFRDQRGWRGRQVMHPIRAAWTGSLAGPCLGAVASLLGARRSKQRIEDVLT